MSPALPPSRGKAGFRERGSMRIDAALAGGLSCCLSAKETIGAKCGAGGPGVLLDFDQPNAVASAKVEHAFLGQGVHLHARPQVAEIVLPPERIALAIG